MPITSDIVESYRRPRAVLRRQLRAEGLEARALAETFSWSRVRRENLYLPEGLFES